MQVEARVDNGLDGGHRAHAKVIAHEQLANRVDQREPELVD